MKRQEFVRRVCRGVLGAMACVAMVAAGMTAFADPSVTINEVKALEPWDSEKGTISVDYSLANIDAKTDYKVVFDITANDETKSVVNAAAKLVAGPQEAKAIDTVTLFGKEVSDAGAKVKVSLIAIAPKDLGGVQLWEDGPYWAECNVGGKMPADYGNYYVFDDVKEAAESLGKGWRAPTQSELAALFGKDCNRLWGTFSDSAGNVCKDKKGGEIRGYHITSKSDSSKSIYLPAAGFIDDNETWRLSYAGYYWSSEVLVIVKTGKVSDTYAMHLWFDNTRYKASTSDFQLRAYKSSVRAVRDSQEVVAVSEAEFRLERLVGVTVNGVDVGAGSGEGWTYDEATHYVEIADAGSYVLSGSNTEGEVMFAIDADASVTLSNLCLKCMTEDECCIWATNDVNVTLYLAGTNELDASASGSGICVENGARLTITNGPGFTAEDMSLIAKGGMGCAAIAVLDNASLEITGGYVEAVGGQWASAIGGGLEGKYGSVTVSGGTVRATGGYEASDMIAGYGNQGGGGFTVTGGSIWLAHGLVDPAPSNGIGRVWCVTVPNVATGKPKIEGLDGYGTKDIVAVDGKIYLWLPDGEYKLIVGGKTYKAKVDGANTEAVEQPATPLAPGHSSDPFNSEAEARAAVQSGLVSFAPAPAVENVLKESTILTVEGYKEMFTPVVYQTKEDGKWRVMYELTEKGTNDLNQSIHAVVTNLDVQAIAAEGVASMSLDGGIPGFYYTLFASDAVTSVTEPSSRVKANSDKLCDEKGVVTFLNVEKPSDAAGFFTVSVSPEQVFTKVTRP